jgi:FemAB-related protein (PEP-CTERM system-associated)
MNFTGPEAGAVMVNELDSASFQRWDAFVETSPEATFFHRARWKTIIEQIFGHPTYYLYAEARGQIEGILPLAEVKSLLFGHALVSLPFCAYGGIVAESGRARAALDQAAQTLASQLGVGHLEYRHLQPLHSEWERSDLYVTFRKEIDPELERNLLNIPRKQRAMVRKGINAGLKSEVDDTVDRFYVAFSTNVHRLGTPAFSKRYFESLKNTFGDDCEILTITKDGRVTSSVMSFYFREEVLPYYAGDTDSSHEIAGNNDFKYWELMRRACERGCRVFDYGRSKRGTGSFAFKSNWGFNAQPLYYEYKLFRSKGVPANNPLNPKYQLFIKLWRKMPLSLANRLGPYLVKNLG